MVETLLKMSEVAELLQVSIKTVRRLVDQGALARIVTGGGTVRKTFAFSADDVEAFIRSRREYVSQPVPLTPRRRRRNASTSSIGSTVFASPERLATLRKGSKRP